MNRRLCAFLSAAALCWHLGGGLEARAADAVAADAAKAPGLLLDAGCLWRCYMVRGTEIVRADGGELVPVHYEQPMERAGKERRIRLRRHPEARFWPAAPAAAWRQPDFDDSGWGALCGPFLVGPRKSDASIYRSVPVLYLRGKFQVKEPSQAGDMTLDLAFHGGVAVYLNGSEVARKHLPAGDLAADVVAEDYPIEAFIGPDGHVLVTVPDAMADESVLNCYRLRRRALAGVRIPARLLRQGLNVLAIEIRRAPLPERFFTAPNRNSGGGYFIRQCGWPRVALAELRLAAPGAPAGALIPNIALSGRPAGFQVWRQPLAQEVTSESYADPCEAGRPVRLAGARNGQVSWQVAAGCTEPILGLTASCSDFVGPGGATIPSAAVAVRYAVDAHPRSHYSQGRPERFAALSEAAPAAVPLDPRTPAAVQPVWFNLRTPRTAVPGDYRGSVTLRATGRPPVSTSVEMRIVDWQLPDARDFFTVLGMIQSPESVARLYGAELWSQRHWQLMEESFKRMGELGVKEVYVTAVRQTHLGNEHAMLRFRREPGGLVPDFTIVDRYLYLAARHLGRPLVVCLYCWEQNGGGHYPSHLSGEKLRGFERKLLLSVVGPGGQLEAADGPAWGSDACRALWRPVFDGLKQRLAALRIEGEVMPGIAGDYLPGAGAVGDLKQASGGARWVRHTHSSAFTIGSKEAEVGYLASAWGGARCQDPDLGRAYGWSAPVCKVVTREFPDDPAFQSLFLEGKVCGLARFPDNEDHGLRGLGRMGADFWPLPDNSGRGGSSLLGCYPETGWGQLNPRLWMPAFFAAGPNGAIHCVRSLIFLQNMQEIEARIFVEKALADKSQAVRVGPELAARAQELLDTRLRMANATMWQYACDRSGTLMCDLGAQTRALYELAAEVAGKLAAAQ